MAYQNLAIRDTIEKINRSYFLPAIQRPFVWEIDQITALFDSIMKGYPISSFLYWSVKQENWNNWEIYKFIENFKHGSTHNEFAQPSGGELFLVLDGQQRLTSLLIGLRGTYTIKQKYKRKGNPLAYPTHKLYFNLLKDGNSTIEDEESSSTYDFRFFDSYPSNDASHHWFRVGEILDFDSEDEFDSYKENLIDKLSREMTRGDEQLIRRNLDKLYRVIWKDQVISFYTERNQDYDRVLDIFVRANSGGANLSKSDLLLSMITSKWNGKNAREEIYNFVDHLNNGMSRRNNFDKDFVFALLLDSF